MNAEMIAFLIIAGSVVLALIVARQTSGRQLTPMTYLWAVSLTTAMSLPIIIKVLCASAHGWN